MAQQTGREHFDATIELLEKDVDNETTKGAQVGINGWIKTLGEHKELKGIADDLHSLKEAITSGEGKAIADLMTKLGKETTEAADKAEGPEAAKIKKLGGALTKAAKAISKLVKA